MIFRNLFKALWIFSLFGVSAIAADRTSPYPSVGWGAAFERHAPLAFFSIGSLAVGGILVGIRAENQAKLNMQSHSPDRDVVWALGLAGLTSVLAGGAFWYYVRAEMQNEQPPSEQGFSMVPIFDGGPGISAQITHSLPSFLQ
jgi:hypothetical protein